MKTLSARGIARKLAEVLGGVEDRRESFRITRHRRVVARITPEAQALGIAVKDLLTRHRVDRAWSDELVKLRASLAPEEPSWRD